MEYDKFTELNLRYGNLILVSYERKPGIKGKPAFRRKNVGFFEGIKEYNVANRKRYTINLGNVLDYKGNTAIIKGSSGRFLNLEEIIKIKLLK